LVNSVLASRDFLLGLNTIFQQVKMSYKIKSPEALAKGGKAQKTIHQTNGKTIFVFISANTGLYGNIIKRTFEVFINQFAKQKTADVAIVGRLGARLFQEKFPRKKFLFFSLSDNKIDHEGIKQILPYLIQYEKVIVFYEQFQNIISSTPIATSVSGDMLPWEKPESQDLKYIFEPSLKKVVEFFEKEIISVIFEQIVYESLLAKFSSRMVAMEEATDNIQTRLKQAILKKGRIKHQELNKKQNESLSSMSLWTTRL
jgi:ATP synthase F1 gamma subunit